MASNVQIKTIPNTGETEPMTKQWWQYPENSKQAAGQLTGLFKSLDTMNNMKQQINLRNLKLYSNREIAGTSVLNYTMAPAAISNQNGPQLSLNVIKSCIDTLVAKLCKSKIKPSFLTSGGNWEKQRQARELNKFISGLFYKVNVFKTAPMCLRDACWSGDGIAKVYTDPSTKEIVCERIFPDELRADPNDAYYGNPSMLFQSKYVNKDILVAQYPESEQAIRTAKSQSSFAQGAFSECVLVVEGWKLASSKSAKDGRHMIAVEDTALFDEVYSRVKFPFAKMSYTKPILGYFGDGICDELVGIQREINRCLIHIQRTMKLLCNPRVYIEGNSQVNTNQITNEIGGVVRYIGQPPVIQAVSAVSPEYGQMLENLYRKAFEIIGISSLSAQSKNPLGAGASGAALREFHDVETERFMLTGQDYEQFHLDIAELMLDEVRDNNSNIEVQAFSRKDGLETINWADIKAEPDDYIMQVFPISALPDNTAARIQTVKEMMQSGMIDPEIGSDLLDFPDLDAHNQLFNSPVRVVRKQIELILDKGKYTSPEPFNNLDKALQYAAMYYNNAQMMDVPEARIEMLRTYMDAVKALKDTATTPPVPSAAPSQELLQSQLSATPSAQANPAQALPPQV